MTPDTRFVAAVLGTPLVVAIMLVLLMVGLSGASMTLEISGWGELEDLVRLTGLIAIAVCIPTFIFGLPLHALLTSMRLRRWPYYLVGDVIVGAAAPLLLGLGHFFDALETGESDGPPLRGIEAAYGFAFLGALLGPVTAVVFWLIRRPDRDTANPPTSAP